MRHPTRTLVKAARRGGPGRVHPGSAEEIEPARRAFEKRLEEFSERLNAIAQSDAASSDALATGTDDAGARAHAPTEWREPARVASEDVRLEPAPAIVAPEPSLAQEALQAYLNRIALGLSRAMRRVSSRSDAEAIHDLRVHARRMVAVLRVWRDLFRRGFRRRTLRLLRDLRRNLGEAREIEVYAELVESRLAHSRPEGRELVELALHQARRRLDPARRRAARLVRAIEPGDLVEALDRAVRRIPDRHARQPDAARAAQARVARAEVDAARAVRAAIERLDNEALHDARIALKKWRYAREAMNAGLGCASDPRLDTVREMQEALGTVQDRASLRRELLPEGAFTEPPEALAPFLEEMDAERRRAVERFLAIARREPWW